MVAVVDTNHLSEIDRSGAPCVPPGHDPKRQIPCACEGRKNARSDGLLAVEPDGWKPSLRACDGRKLFHCAVERRAAPPSTKSPAQRQTSLHRARAGILALRVLRMAGGT